MASVKRLETHYGGNVDRRQERSSAQVTMARWLNTRGAAFALGSASGWLNGLARGAVPKDNDRVAQADKTALTQAIRRIGEFPYAFRNSRML